MGITIKSANPDDIWESWKRKASKSQKLEKHYGTKGAVFNLEQVTATEIVKAGRLATTVRKRFIIAVPDSEKNRIRYLIFKWFKA